FSFELPDDLWYIPSFPTRRSSDLWATDLAGGSAFGYTLLSVILVSNLMAILLQGLAAKLGIVTGRDLAQACRDHYSRPATLSKRSEEHTSELQSRGHLVCRLLLEK